MSIEIKRKDIKFAPDPTRVIARFTNYSYETNTRIIGSVMRMSDKEVEVTLNQFLRDYTKRHRNISTILEKNFKKISYLFQHLNIDALQVDLNRKLLIGSYVTMEYAVESAAFFNPSIVEHPDQTKLQP